MKNSAKTNILIFDEILDSNLDLVAREQVGNIIRDIKDSNTIVISHADANGDEFDCTLQIEKKGDFSFYTEIQ
jgi:ABC-type multidrug transport system ATPase subunit